jgi:thiol-disulfide isomerase/thioredoxin
LKKAAPFSNVANAASGDGSNQDAVIFLYYADWCPACKKAKPKWDEFKSQYDGQMVGNYKLLFKEVDCTNNEDKEVAAQIQENNINGFPTIQMVVAGNTVNFDAAVTKENLQQFVEQILAQQNV